MRWQIIILAVLAAASAALYRQQSQPTESNDSEEDVVAIDRREPDVYGEQIRVTQMRPDGSLHYHLDASDIRQFELEQLTRMRAPQLHLTSAAQPPWNIASKHGYLRRRPGPNGVAEDVVYLREDVKMVQQHPHNGITVMHSSAFYIYPGREYAETDQNVMIDTEVGRTEASGLTIDLVSGHLKLASNAQQRVHTIILPEQFKGG